MVNDEIFTKSAVFFFDVFPKELIKTNEVYLYNASIFNWTDLNRWNYTANSPPPYSIYTGLTLGKASNESKPKWLRSCY